MFQNDITPRKSESVEDRGFFFTFSPDRMSIQLQVFKLLSYKGSAQELIDAECIAFFNEEFLSTHTETHTEN